MPPISSRTAATSKLRRMARTGARRGGRRGKKACLAQVPACGRRWQRYDRTAPGGRTRPTHHPPQPKKNREHENHPHHPHRQRHRALRVHPPQPPARATPILTYVQSFGNSGSGFGQFSYAAGVTVDSAGNVYVADTFNNRIDRFNPANFAGTFTSFGSGGSGSGQFNLPYVVAVDSAGYVYSNGRLRTCLKKQAGGATEVAQTSKSAVSRVSKPASDALFQGALDFRRAADLEVGDTAGLETCATPEAWTLFRQALRPGAAWLSPRNA